MTKVPFEILENKSFISITMNIKLYYTPFFNGYKVVPSKLKKAIFPKHLMN